MRWLDSITNSMDMNWSKLREIVKDREAWHAADHWAAKLLLNKVSSRPSFPWNVVGGFSDPL